MFTKLKSLVAIFEDGSKLVLEDATENFVGYESQDVKRVYYAERVVTEGAEEFLVHQTEYFKTAHVSSAYLAFTSRLRSSAPHLSSDFAMPFHEVFKKAVYRTHP